MKQIGLSIRLRPLRFAFLVRANDAKNLQRIFEVNTSLWGGIFNPIIPYFRRVPQWWDRHSTRGYNARSIIDGYLSFFEPDFVVETEKGLGEKLGLSKQIILNIDDILMNPSERRNRDAYGLNAFELYKYLYHKEFKFVRRHEHRIVSVLPEHKNFTLFVSCIFGAFPKENQLKYIEKAFQDAFDPEKLILNPQNLISIYKKSAESALDIGYEKLDVNYSDRRDLTLFLLDAKEPKDLIDFWNMRTIERNVWAIPIQWIQPLSNYCREFIERNHVPLPGNPHGVMIHTTIQISRSIPETKVEELHKQLKSDKHDAAVIRLWYPRYWEPPSDLIWAPRRPVLTAAEKQIEVMVSDSENSITFDTLSPEFAAKYSNHYRWANVVEMKDWSFTNEIATVFPNNLREPSFPSLSPGNLMLSTKEGLVVFPKYKEVREYWKVIDGTSAFIKWFEKQNYKAEISAAGKTLLQLLNTLEGLRGVGSISHAEIIKLLNKMAHKQVKISSDEGGYEPKEYFGRTVKFGEFQKLINDINKPMPWSKFGLSALNKFNVIRLGLEVKCDICDHRNWYSIDFLNYKLVCENCLKEFFFPIDSPTNRKINWCYRAIGPFCKPDFAQGAYTSALAIRFFARSLGLMDSNAITWSTSLKLSFQSGKESEVDFALWYQRKGILENNYDVNYVFGESKSFGKDAFESRDVKRLKTIASFYPGSALVFATMKDNLTMREKKQISSLALWGREYAKNGKTRAPVIILTGTELFVHHYLESAWKEKGSKHAELVEPAYVRIENLRVLADLTQQLYLNLPSFHEWWNTKGKAKARKKSQPDQK